jgi:hypothetical protein
LIVYGLFCSSPVLSSYQCTEKNYRDVHETLNVNDCCWRRSTCGCAVAFLSPYNLLTRPQSFIWTSEPLTRVPRF